MYKIDRRGGGGAGGVQKNGILGQITLCYFVLRLTKDYFWVQKSYTRKLPKIDRRGAGNRGPKFIYLDGPLSFSHNNWPPGIFRNGVIY